MRDFRHKEDKQVFGVRAAALIIVENHLVCLKDNQHCYIPGGALCVNETTKEAVVREVKEEISIHVEVDRLLFVAENFFDQASIAYHNIEFYYICHTKDNVPHYANENNQVRQVVRIPLSDLSLYDIRPSFLKEKWLDDNQPTNHIVTIGV